MVPGKIWWLTISEDGEARLFYTPSGVAKPGGEEWKKELNGEERIRIAGILSRINEFGIEDVCSDYVILDSPEVQDEVLVPRETSRRVPLASV